VIFPRRFLRTLPPAVCFHALLLFCGCAASLFNSKPLPEMTPGTLLEQIGEHTGRLKTFQGRGIFTVASDAGAFRGEISIVTRRPDSLWFKLEGPLGIDLVTARFAGGRFAFYSPWIKNSFRDSLSQMDFRRLLPAGLDSLDVLTGLLGMPELKSGSLDSARSVSREKGHYVLNVGSSESIWVEPRGPVITRWEKRDGEGKTVWLYEADMFRNCGDVRLPKRIRFIESEAREMVLYYEDIRINKPLKRGWSDVRLPKGAEIRTL
jgi:hypothetical protein